MSIFFYHEEVRRFFIIPLATYFFPYHSSSSDLCSFSLFFSPLFCYVISVWRPTPYFVCFERLRCARYLSHSKLGIRKGFDKWLFGKKFTSIRLARGDALQERQKHSMQNVKSIDAVCYFFSDFSFLSPFLALCYQIFFNFQIFFSFYCYVQRNNKWLLISIFCRTSLHVNKNRSGMIN